jgi:hypothetical protein
MLYTEVYLQITNSMKFMDLTGLRSSDLTSIPLELVFLVC